MPAALTPLADLSDAFCLRSSIEIHQHTEGILDKRHTLRVLSEIGSIDKSLCADTVLELREFRLDDLLVLLEDGSHLFFSRIIDESAGTHWLGLSEPLLSVSGSEAKT